MTEARTVLIADDEPLKVLTLEEHLVQAGYKVLTAVSGDAALALLKQQAIDALVTDVRMPGLDGLALLEESMKLDPARPVLVMTGYGDVQTAVQAMKGGAIDYVLKPVSGEEIALRLDRALAESALVGENLQLRHEVQRLGGQSKPAIIGRTMRAVCESLEKAAGTDATVLLHGETGTGKEVCARHLHSRSTRARGPFVVVPCATLSPSLIESELFGHEKGAFTGAAARRNGFFAAAESGTLFLDDVDDLPLEMQGKLLHVLQSRTYNRVGGTRAEKADVRIVAATKHDLREQVAQRRFRDDLMYRLNVVTIVIPPLRQRKEDIPELAEFFLKCAMSRFGRSPKHFTPDALQALTAYSWPGNVRELEHLVESVVIMHSDAEINAAAFAPVLRLDREYSLFSLNTSGQETISLEKALLDFERALLTWAFEKSEHNQVRAAKLLGIPRSTFQYRWTAAVAPLPGGTPCEVQTAD
ncbi:MAG: sigma-54 dependent transcriptional regulator [Planctomycetota bacterium]